MLTPVLANPNNPVKFDCVLMARLLITFPCPSNVPWKPFSSVFPIGLNRMRVIGEVNVSVEENGGSVE